MPSCLLRNVLISTLETKIVFFTFKSALIHSFKGPDPHPDTLPSVLDAYPCIRHCAFGQCLASQNLVTPQLSARALLLIGGGRLGIACAHAGGGR